MTSTGTATPDTGLRPETPSPPRSPTSRRRELLSRRWVVGLIQTALVVAALALWEYLPRIESVAAASRFLDPYFISSPSRIYHELVDIVVGTDGLSVWPYVWPTFGASIIGAVGGLAIGGSIGLVLGSVKALERIFRPFVIVFNAIPRIALIPIIIVIMGAGIASSMVIAILVVLFVGLFNAQEGARSVQRHVLDNVWLIGASRWEIMWRVRARYALAWTLSGLPIAVSFAIVSVVSGEILIGGGGLGTLMSLAAVQANADLTFAVIVFLAVFALLILGLAEVFTRRALRWWNAGTD